MNIEFGNIIRKLIVLICYYKSTNWSGIIKLHLKISEIEWVGVFKWLRPFILQLDDEKFKRKKVCNTYESLALKKNLLVKITSDELETKKCYELFKNIVGESFQRGTRYKIINIQNKK